MGNFQHILFFDSGVVERPDYWQKAHGNNSDE